MARIPTELKLAKVLSKMLARNMNMGSADRTLQQRPEALKAIGVMHAAHPFFGLMIDRAVLIAEPRKLRIGFQFVSRDSRAFPHVLDDMGLKRYAPDVSDNPRHYVALAFRHSEHNSFPGSTAPPFAARMAATNHRFIGFDMTRKLVVSINLCHVLAKFMRHAPRCFIVHAKLAFEFLCRDTVARRSEEIHRVKPLLQRHASAAERRAYHRVNVVPTITGIGWHLRQLAKFADLAAALARDIFAIPLLEKMRQTRVIVRELCEKVLNCDTLCHGSLQLGHYGISSSIRQADNRLFFWC